MIGAYEAATDIFNGLGKLGTGNIPSLEQIVHTVQSSGVDALNATLAARYPTIVTIIPNGIKANFGTGTTLPNGNVLKGSATATYSNLVRTSSKVSLNFAASSTNLTKNGALLPLTSATGSVNINVDASGHLIGDTSVNAQGSTSQGPVSVSGNAHVDTTKCKNYPVSGSVSVTDNGITKTISFNDKCDGTFGYDSGSAQIWQLDMPWPDCVMNPQHPGIGSGWSSPLVMAENGHLTPISIPTFNTPKGNGWYTASAAHLDMDYFWSYPPTSFPGLQWDQYKVTFDGHQAPGGGKYIGTFTVQTINHLVDGSAHSCSYSCDIANKPCGCLHESHPGWAIDCPVN